MDAINASLAGLGRLSYLPPLKPSPSPPHPPTPRLLQLLDRQADVRQALELIKRNVTFDKDVRVRRVFRDS